MQEPLEGISFTAVFSLWWWCKRSLDSVSMNELPAPDADAFK